MRWIYLSPHFDDVVLSCGGLIWEQSQKGVPVEIWTVCGGDAPSGSLSRMAKKIHKESGTGSAEETILLRRSEDREAAYCVGASVFHFNTPDCIYRRSTPGVLLYTMGIFTPWNPLEAYLHEEIAAALTAMLLPEDVLVCPLAIGGHIDHMLTRLAVESLRRTLLYYADIPYVLSRPKALAAVTGGLTTETYPISGEGLHAWQSGIAAYRSQITILFKTPRRMRMAISRYWESRHGVRLWRIE